MFCDLLEAQLAGGTPTLPCLARWFKTAMRDLEARRLSRNLGGNPHAPGERHELMKIQPRRGEGHEEANRVTAFVCIGSFVVKK